MRKREAEEKRRPFQSTLDAFPDHVKAIGMISIEIANLEFALGDLLGAVLHIRPDFARTIYQTPNAGMGRLAILDNAIDDALIKDSDGHKHLRSITKAAKALMGQRHEMIHDAWGTAEEDRTKIMRRAVPFRDTRPAKPVALADLTDMVTRIRALGERARAATVKAYQEWPPYTPGQLVQQQAPKKRKAKRKAKR
jgi:hypothetical protein